MGRRDLSLVDIGGGCLLGDGCYDVGLPGWVGVMRDCLAVLGR